MAKMSFAVVPVLLSVWVAWCTECEPIKPIKGVTEFDTSGAAEILHKPEIFEKTIKPKLDALGFNVLFSFGAKQGGMPHVTNMKEQLPKYFDEVMIITPYLDSAVLPCLPGSYKVTGSDFPLNVYWQDAYKHVMGNVGVMVFLITNAWLRSPNCHQEMDWVLEGILKKESSKIVVVLFGLAMEVMARFEGIAVEVYKDEDERGHDRAGYDFYAKYNKMQGIFGDKMKTMNVQYEIHEPGIGWLEQESEVSKVRPRRQSTILQTIGHALNDEKWGQTSTSGDTHFSIEEEFNLVEEEEYEDAESADHDIDDGDDDDDDDDDDEEEEE